MKVVALIFLVLFVGSTVGQANFPTCECELPGCCTHSWEYWGTHYSGAPMPGDDIPWPTGCAIANYSGETTSLWGTTWLAIVQPPQTLNPCGKLAKEYIAAVLNHCNGSCVDGAVAVALVGASDILFDEFLCPERVPFPNGTIPEFPRTFTNILTILRNYNDGLRGPGACDDCNEGCTRSAGWHKTVCKRFGVSDAPGFPTQPPPDTGQIPTSTFTTEFELPPDGTPFERCECLGIGRSLQQFTRQGVGSSMCDTLVKQYAAARLNVMCGRACVPDGVLDAMGNASCLLRGLVDNNVCCLGIPLDPFVCDSAQPPCNPSTADKLKPQTPFPELRHEAERLKDIIEEYNTGLTDPGSCDEILRHHKKEEAGGAPPPSIAPKKLPEALNAPLTDFQIGFWVVLVFLFVFVCLSIGLLFWGLSKGTGRKRR